MILDAPVSEVGRSSGQHLDALRKQLGVGCDPAYDYTAMIDMAKNLLKNKSKKKGHSDSEPDLRSSMRSPTDGIDDLKRAMHDASGEGAPGAGTRQGSKAGTSKRDFPRVPGGARWLADQSRPSASFVVTTRDYERKQDVALRWRAPPVGSYRPKDEICQPRMKNITTLCASDKEPSRSRKLVEMEREIADLKADGQSTDHLERSCVSVELLNEPPERTRKRQVVFRWDKGGERPDPVKSGGIVYNNNSFTAGVMDGDLKCSQMSKVPLFDFANLSSYEPKPREYYFQPGQYNPNLSASRPRSICKSAFEKYPNRKPLRECVGRVEIKERAGAHLPDRSLSRSCPLLEPQFARLKVPDLSKYTNRPALTDQLGGK